MAGKHSVYKKQIIDHLYFSGTLSCSEISKKTGRSLTLITKMVNALVAEGLVVEEGYAPSTGGRRPQMYSLHSDKMYTVSVAMDQFTTRMAVMNMHNRFVTEVEVFALDLARESDLLPKLIDRIRQTIEKSGVGKDRILGVGIGMPGFVNAGEGLNYSFPKIYQGNISTCISARTGLPVYIDNDSRVIALAEQKFGAARQYENVMVINIGWGVGLGLILENTLLKGADGFAGEFSHIPLFQNGKLCSCGKSGCLETEASLTAVMEKAIAGVSAGRTSILKKEQLQFYAPDAAGTFIFSAATQGDRFAVELLSEAGYNMGRGIAILIHLLNPALVILSGKGAVAGNLLQAPIQTALNEYCIPKLTANTRIIVSCLGHDAQLIGGAALVMEKHGKSSLAKKKLRKAA